MCDKPAPANGGARCDGSASEEQSCNSQECHYGLYYSNIFNMGNLGLSLGSIHHKDFYKNYCNTNIDISIEHYCIYDKAMSASEVISTDRRESWVGVTSVLGLQQHGDATKLIKV